MSLVQYLASVGSDLDKAESYGATPLLIAAQKGHVEVVKCLADAGADLNKTDTDGVTPMYSAAQNGFLSIVQCLVEAGADAQIGTTVNGATPLVIAAQRRQHEVVRYLEQTAGAYVPGTKRSVHPFLMY